MLRMDSRVGTGLIAIAGYIDEAINRRLNRSPSYEAIEARKIELALMKKERWRGAVDTVNTDSINANGLLKTKFDNSSSICYSSPNNLEHSYNEAISAGYRQRVIRKIHNNGTVKHFYSLVNVEGEKEILALQRSAEGIDFIRDENPNLKDESIVFVKLKYINALMLNNNTDKVIKSIEKQRAEKEIQNQSKSNIALSAIHDYDFLDTKPTKKYDDQFYDVAKFVSKNKNELRPILNSSPNVIDLCPYSTPKSVIKHLDLEMELKPISENKHTYKAKFIDKVNENSLDLTEETKPLLSR